MYSKEEMLDALEEFKRKATDKIPPVLEAYLRKVAVTGETMFPWYKVRTLMVHKLDQVMTDFYSQAPLESSPPAAANAHTPAFTAMRQRILQAMGDFSGAPFTIQRLCELMTEPGKHYRRTDKFLRGIEKNLLVVSAVDPQGIKIVSEPMVNGTDSNGFESVQRTPEKHKHSLMPPPVPTNSPATTWPSGSTASSLTYTNLPQVSPLAVSSTGDSSGPPEKRQRLSDDVTESISSDGQVKEGRPGESANTTGQEESTGAADSSESVESKADNVSAKVDSKHTSVDALDSASSESTSSEAEPAAVNSQDSQSQPPRLAEPADEASTSDITDLDEERRDSNDSQGFDAVVESMDTHQDCEAEEKASPSTNTSGEKANSPHQADSPQTAEILQKEAAGSEATSSSAVAPSQSMKSNVTESNVQESKPIRDCPDSTDHGIKCADDGSKDKEEVVSASENQVDSCADAEKLAVDSSVSEQKPSSPQPSAVSQAESLSAAPDSHTAASASSVDSTQNSSLTASSHTDSSSGCDSSSQSAVNSEASPSPIDSSAQQACSSNNMQSSSSHSPDHEPMETE